MQERSCRTFRVHAYAMRGFLAPSERWAPGPRISLPPRATHVPTSRPFGAWRLRIAIRTGATRMNFVRLGDEQMLTVPEAAAAP